MFCRRPVFGFSLSLAGWRCGEVASLGSTDLRGDSEGTELNGLGQ